MFKILQQLLTYVPTWILANEIVLDLCEIQLHNKSVYVDYATVTYEIYDSSEFQMGVFCNLCLIPYIAVGA
jgi:hypothetical protein